MEARELLRRRREASGLTQEQLAHKAGKTKGSVAGYETGLFNPSRKAAQALDDALDAGGAVMEAFFPAVTPLDELGRQVAALAAEVAELQRQVARLLELQGD